MLTQTDPRTREIERLRAIVDLDGATPGVEIDWQLVVERLGRCSETVSAPDRTHLVTADTYRYLLATVLGASGVSITQLELTNPASHRYAAMTLHTRRRTALAVMDLRDQAGDLVATLTSNLMDDLHRTARLDADERVVVVIGGEKAHGVMTTHIPEALHANPGEPVTLWFQRAVQAGLTLDGFAHHVPDLTLTRLGRRQVTHHHVLAIGVGTRHGARP